MSKELSTLRKNGLLGHHNIEDIFVDVSGEATAKGRLKRQGINAIGHAYALGFTKREMAEHFDCSLNTIWKFENNLPKDDLDYLKACKVIMAEDLVKECLRSAVGKMNLDELPDDFKQLSQEEQEQIYKEKLANVTLSKGSAEWTKIVLSAANGILDRDAKTSTEKAPATVNNTTILLDKNPSWIPPVQPKQVN